MSMRLQVDGFGIAQRLSLGEFDESFPKASPLGAVLDFMIDAVGGWTTGRCVLVGHWSQEAATVGWRRVTSFPYRDSLLRSSTIQLAEIPSRDRLTTALEYGWRLPRLLLCVVARSAEEEIVRLDAAQWKSVLEEEISPKLLSLQLPMVVLGFFHQRWLSAYLPKSAGMRVGHDLLARFHEELVLVSNEL